MFLSVYNRHIKEIFEVFIEDTVPMNDLNLDVLDFLTNLHQKCYLYADICNKKIQKVGAYVIKTCIKI